MVNSDRDGAGGFSTARKVRGGSVERIQDNKENAKNKRDNASQQSLKSFESLWGSFVCDTKCPMKDVGVVLDGFLQSLLAVHILASLPKVGE